MLLASLCPSCGCAELRPVASPQTCRALAATQTHSRCRRLLIKAASTLEAPERPSNLSTSSLPDLLTAVKSIYTTQVRICMHHMLDAQLDAQDPHLLLSCLNSIVLRRTIWRMPSVLAIQLKTLSSSVQAGKNSSVPGYFCYLWRTSISRFTSYPKPIAMCLKPGVVSELQLHGHVLHTMGQIGLLQLVYCS
jgi:hypothetical protein